MTSTTYAHSKHVMGNNPDIPIDIMAYTITIYLNVCLLLNTMISWETILNPAMVKHRSYGMKSFI